MNTEIHEKDIIFPYMMGACGITIAGSLLTLLVGNILFWS